MGGKQGFFIWVLLVFLAYLLKEVSCDSYLINCGSHNNFTIDNHVYLGEGYTHRYVTTPINILANNTSTNANLNLYKSARIFNGKTMYKFPIDRMGRYLIRFHFFPFTYQTYNLSNAKMYVSAGKFELMNNYTPPTSGIIKEYSITMSSKSLEIVLAPISNSVAFLNALEVLLVPNALISDDATLVNSTKSFIGLPKAALETSFRVNMGGSIIDYNNDTLWRTWNPDDSFLRSGSFSTKFHNNRVVHYRSGLSTSNFAPIAIYGTCRTNKYNSNMTWTFNVDLGFQYLVRLHFCDIVSSSRNQMFFNVFVNSWLVSRPLNLTGLALGFLATPVYIDFVTPMIQGNVFSVSISPIMTKKNKYGAILNGLEIMKINNDESSLAVVVSTPSFQPVSSKSREGVLVWVIIVSVSILVLAIILFVWNKKRIEGLSQHHLETSSSHSTTLVPLNTGFYYPLAYIHEATNNFDESRKIGQGASGKVYIGFLRDGKKVAVKKLATDFRQDSHDEFRTEIELLSHANHRHLVSLVGYCDEGNEKILIYEYMGNGDLRDHIFKENCLSWEQRVNICIGAARGLDYLHNDGPQPVIHRDVKAANILLDENFDAKVSDFGLLKVGATNELHSYATMAKGTVGYIDPTYFKQYKVTQKSDVYSFGIVLLEVLCGKPVLDDNRVPCNLVLWASEFLHNREFEKIVDPRLQDEIKQEALELYGETIVACIDDIIEKRPSMYDIVRNLNHVKKIQMGTRLDEDTTFGLHDSLTDPLITFNEILEIQSIQTTLQNFSELPFDEQESQHSVM